MGYTPPPDDLQGEPDLYASLVLGRAHQLDFWQNALTEDAFGTLSRQHVEVQTWQSLARNRFSFLVRNLSDVNPVHVRSGSDRSSEVCPITLEKDDQQHLLDGDEIVLNLNQQHTF